MINMMLQKRTTLNKLLHNSGLKLIIFFRFIQTLVDLAIILINIELVNYGKFFGIICFISFNR